MACFKFTAPLLALASLFAGCEEIDTVDRVFDERGQVWSLRQYSTDGTNTFYADGHRKDAFLLAFSEPQGIMAAASCAGSDGDEGVSSSSCKLGGPETRTWDCECYSYEWSEGSLFLFHFQEGSWPPDALVGGDQVRVTDQGIGKFRAQPLPAKLFNSDGMGSRYDFETKSTRVFDETGCAIKCFGNTSAPTTTAPPSNTSLTP